MSDQEHHHTAEHSCPHCGYVTNRAGRPTGTDDGNPASHRRGGGPKDGDLSVCLACAGVSVFVVAPLLGAGALRLRLPTIAEQAAIMGNMYIQLAVASVAVEKARAHGRGEQWAGEE